MQYKSGQEPTDLMAHATRPDSVLVQNVARPKDAADRVRIGLYKCSTTAQTIDARGHQRHGGQQQAAGVIEAAVTV
jgi:hypothetical protein